MTNFTIFPLDAHQSSPAIDIFTLTQHVAAHQLNSILNIFSWTILKRYLWHLQSLGGATTTT